MMVMSFAGMASAEQASDPACDDKVAARPQVEFKHADANEDRHYTVSLKAGESLVVCIADTAIERFSYSIVGVKKAPEPRKDAAAAGDNGETLGTKRLVRPHDPAFGGYIVSITRSTPAPVRAQWQGKPVELNDVTLVVSVKEEQFQYEFSGAFSISSLVDSQYAATKATVDGKEVLAVTRDRAAEDERRLGLGAFIHVFHDKAPWVAATFGLGVASDNKVTYFLGPSIRLGKAMAVTAGPVWGAVTRLPTGVSEGSVIADANALKDLPTRTGRGWFVGFSYTFLQARQTIEKPFAPPAK
jgi:hypothetical protein